MLGVLGKPFPSLCGFQFLTQRGLGGALTCTGLILFALPLGNKGLPSNLWNQ